MVSKSMRNTRKHNNNKNTSKNSGKSSGRGKVTKKTSKTRKSYIKGQTRNQNHNQKHNHIHKSFQKSIVKDLLEILNTIKLYHWKTLSYATHIATDDLHKNLSTHIDKYVEVMIGKMNVNIHMSDYSCIKMKNLENNNALERFIRDFIIKFEDLHDFLPEKGNTDLMNIRDDIITDLQQFLYLLRLK